MSAQSFAVSGNHQPGLSDASLNPVQLTSLEKNLRLQLVKGNPLLYINGMKNQQTGDADE